MADPDPQPARRKSGLFSKVLLGIALVIVALAVVVAMQPADFRIERAATISAPPAAVFAQVNDFHNWQAWSPWEKLDPNMKKTYEGEPGKNGATYAWSGNNEVGEGKMTLEESTPNERIKIKLEFLKPFAATNTTEFTFKPQGDQTVVTWTMSGQKNFMAKAFHMIMDMDKMVGSDFEKGLASMKTVVEKPAKE